MRCKQNDCNRRSHTSGLCTTHYWRRRNGQPMDAPIRRYVRPEEQSDGPGERVTRKPTRRKRKRPFEAEYALLAELGLGKR
jgi:hypothetical protein